MLRMDAQDDSVGCVGRRAYSLFTTRYRYVRFLFFRPTAVHYEACGPVEHQRWHFAQ